MAWEEAGGEVEEPSRRKAVFWSVGPSGVPPLNLLWRKSVFLGLVALGVSEQCSHQFGEWFVELKISMLYMWNRNSYNSLCRTAFSL